MTEQCNIPPEGWKCSRNAGHEGPCAATPIEFKYVPDDIRKQVAMSMRTIGLHNNGIVKSTLAIQTNTGVETALGYLSVISDENVRGYLPSRVWYDRDAGVFRVSYYTNPTLHVNARPFKDGNTYVLVFMPEEDTVYQYPEDWRVFIEHVVYPPAPIGIAYVMIFGEEMYNEIIAEDQ